MSFANLIVLFSLEFMEGGYIQFKIRKSEFVLNGLMILGIINVINIALGWNDVRGRWGELYKGIVDTYNNS